MAASFVWWLHLRFLIISNYLSLSINQIPNDEKVAAFIAQLTGTQLTAHDFVLEGGAIDGDGQGNWLTTRQCLLNPNRNPHWGGQADAEAALSNALGARQVIWLGDGLANDHTDGHVDNIARFVAPGVALCQSPHGEDDPNRAVLDEIHRTLSAAKTAEGAPLKVLTIPSPGRIKDEDGKAVPASHMNFIIGNASLVLPVYGPADSPNIKEAVEVLSATVAIRPRCVFSDRGVVLCCWTAVSFCCWFSS